MPDLHPQPLIGEAISRFRGQIYQLKGEREIPVRLSRFDDKFNFGLSPQDDWLQVGGNEAPPVFEFSFIEQVDERLHFHISGVGRSSTKKLGVSRNGYLGLYLHAEVKDFWKLEPLAWTERGLVCHWRDHRGHHVKKVSDDPHFKPGSYAFLNVDQADECEVCQFLVTRLD